MMAQFHPFTELPKELRDQIWDMAIRDDNPAVHFFTVYSTEEDNNLFVVDPAKKVHATRASSITPWFYVGLAAPRCRASGQLSWTEGNISTYLTDSGLWTACHESRDRMLRRLRPSETSPQASPQHMPLHEQAIWDITCKPTASINMEFIRDNGEHQSLTIRPSADLIVVQLSKNTNISWDSPRLWEGIQDFPSFRWHTIRGSTHTHWTSSDITNVAVEYDPAWAISDPQEQYESFRDITNGFGNVNDISSLEKFWLIDYNLKRKYNSANPYRQTFRAGRLIFIEVDLVDDEWCCCPKEGPHCLANCEQGPGRDTRRSAHALARELQGLIEMLDNDEWGSDRLHVYTGAELGVLACVDLELEGELPTYGEWCEMNV